LTESVDFRAVASAIELDPAQVPTIIGAADRSWRRLLQARDQLRTLDDDGSVAIFALGSLGRLEASAASDLDLAVVYRGSETSAERASGRRAAAAALLRELDFAVADKTFARALEVGALIGDIGGQMDTCGHLTYRALILTEGAYLHGPAACRTIRETIFRAYTEGAIASGRFLSALGNDLHRYYRTICVDYRFKVEVAGKGWALRNLKLRHSRKVWHLANLVLFCWASELADDAREGLLGSQLPRPPLVRIADGLAALDAAPLAGALFLAYERFLAAIAAPETRAHLDALAHESRYASTIYRGLRANADDLDTAAATIIDHLLGRCHRYLIRFGLL